VQVGVRGGADVRVTELAADHVHRIPAPSARSA
jgi:hypothetical protein